LSDATPSAFHPDVAEGPRRLGALFVISAPSGTGKSTLYRALRATPDFKYSVSCTTRLPRPGEIDGRDYHFLDEADFVRRVEAGEFLESAHVHGNYYGTLRENVIEDLEAGVDLLLDLDIQGVLQMRDSSDPIVREAMADVFLMPPNRDVLETRLRKRGTETPGQIEVRLANAIGEMAYWKDYRYTIISGSPEDDLRNFRAIMSAERCRSSRLRLDRATAKLTPSHG